MFKYGPHIALDIGSLRVFYLLVVGLWPISTCAQWTAVTYEIIPGFYETYMDEGITATTYHDPATGTWTTFIKGSLDCATKEDFCQYTDWEEIIEAQIYRFEMNTGLIYPNIEDPDDLFFEYTIWEIP